MEQKKTNWLSVTMIAGAWVSFCIGSGFATGQELLQYFGAYGALGFGAIIVGMILHGYSSASFLKLGNEQHFHNPMDVFDYYCGKTFGKLFKLLSVFFLLLSPIVMIAGFGAALNQHFGAPLSVGAAVVGILCIITILLGLKKMVEILGFIGPVIIFITLFTGGIYLIQHWELLVDGMSIAPQESSLRMGTSWVDSGILYAAWAPMISAPFLVASATTVKSPRDAALGGIVGTIFYGLACVVMVAAFFCNYVVIGKQAVPTLYLANTISPLLGYAFLAVIFLGIYSSAVPSLFTFCATFFKEGTNQHRIFTVVAVAAATIISVTVPFGTLLNWVYTFYGYLGMLFFVLMAVKQIRVAKERKSIQSQDQ